MDPDANWQLLLEAITEQDWERTSELAQAVLVWLDRGGFPPQSVLRVNLGKEWDTAVTRFACAYALATATRESMS
ncbi:MAG: hypothetical protein IH991_00600 [Planctomycetes bacterium]|nr:hypothetical protein [Planctomycetota bacterium]